MALAGETATELVTRVTDSSYDDLLERKGEIAGRLAAIEIHEQAPAPKRKLPKKGAPNKKQRQTKKASSAQVAAAAIASQPAPGPPLIPQITKTDTHWDFVMKEMMWLGVDFSAERKRQLSLAKKLAGGVRQYHKTKESRKLRELQEAELKRRKLAARLARECKGWWTKVERVVTYKQKLHADDQRQKAMNKQLVALVKQTERYSESLSRVKDYSEEEEEDDEDESDSVVNVDDNNDDIEKSGTDENHEPKQRKHSKRPRRSGNHTRRNLTIEEALASEYKLASRKSKASVTDYSRMRLPEGDDALLYGESTASDNDNSGYDDESYCPESASDDADDETTMREAEHVELEERKKAAGGAVGEDTVGGDSNSNSNSNQETFIADPEELKKLHEEADMEIDQVIERLQKEGRASQEVVVEEPVEGVGTRRSKRVKFVGSAEASENARLENVSGSVDPTPSSQDKERPQSHKAVVTKHAADPGNDADDDGDASDVEDFVAIEVDDNTSDNDDNDGSGSEEFQADEQEVDDETTMIQEEQLPQQMSVQHEIDLLKKESEVSVEELRAIYAKMEEHSNYQPSEDDRAQEEAELEDPKAEEAPANSETLTGDLPEKTREIPDKTQESTEYESTLKDSNEDVQDADDDEFNPNVAEVDDETTMEAEERLGREMTYEQEIAMLKRESEMSVEDLRAMYAAMDEGEDDSSVPDGDEESSEKEEKKESLVDALAAATDGNIEDGGDFQPNEAEGLDDERTLDAEEKLGRDMSYDEEIAMLKRESEMSVEELKAMYASMQTDSGSEAVTDDPASTDDEKRESVADMLASAGDGDAEDYQPDDAEAVDDETTFEAEERLGRDMSRDEELALLKKESEMSVEELRAMYAGAESDDEVVQSESTEMDVEEGRHSSGKRKRESDDDSDGDAEISPRELETETSDDGLAALNALEASAERARQTLATRPYLLASWVKMREYQQIGLNWLVSLQSRRLNGILADEMGLGKTLQTISLFSYLASYKGIWGPHLVVVPTSVIINWETELKRFCPALKVLCYYGSAKRRKELRTGWTKSNWYHVVITSYQLAVQDAFAFKRKRWYYLVLDEAQNIKNFQSQRWQTLINFNTQRRLLLTGTPLQNNLMELWSLLHFLMPYIFRSRKEFSYWFSNPMNNMIEGNSDRNEDVISRLHGIIRPFVLRRLKKDVETQMPGKYEHVVKCQLSRRQMSLYEEFLSRSSTRHALKKGGNFMGMMTVLMQLRKVCNHPDLFEPRSVVTPFVVPSLSIPMASCVFDALKDGPVIERLSVNLIQPLWCGSSGLPSIEASLRHDTIESKQLQAFDASGKMQTSFPSESKVEEDCPKELRPLFEEIQELHCRAHLEKSKFHQKLNAWRCQSPSFPYSTRFLKTVEVRDSALYRQDPVEVDRRKIVLTPASLLEMRKTEQQRADDMDEVFDKFVFCVPRAGARRPKFDTKATNIPSDQLGEMLLEPLEELMNPSRKVEARLSSFFPDKKLIQFDSGKLQTLAELLHKLKRGGHRALIFTQMGKMLDILEAFLNINGHTYLRLDGSTGIERRQRYMDRFNNDTKIFCFILSTRSGGTGVNLTGADTVIFYDSDWNPAMDAQAQDRAHRIGQTRDVHIYRLITEHTIEENILMKAKQKRNLDIMVMDQGKFDASQPSLTKESESQDNDAQDVYTKGGLRAILGVSDNDDDGTSQMVEGGEAGAKDQSDLSKEQMESAMTALEDDDDVKALRGAQKEAAEELQEFDENAEIKKDSDAEDDDAEMDENEDPKTQDKDVAKEETGTDQKNEESELEKEFEAWQTSVGLDASTIEASLSPMERYGLNFREEIDPFYSIFSVQEYRRKMEATEIEDDIDVDEIDRGKAIEERRAMDEGDLLATRPRPEDLIRQRNLYKRERARLRADKMRRKLTGENWSSKIDGQTKSPFWYNSDTGEAVWDKPVALIELEAEDKAHQQGWNALPLKPLVHVMEFLIPYPERTCCSAVCHQWRMAADNVKFVKHVYPVEMGALAREESRREYNHFSTIAEALSIALPGDTIELADGHYWVNEPGLSIDKPIRIVGDENNAANVVLEMSGSLRWAAKGGWIEGVTFRRPKISSGTPPSVEMLRVEGDGKVDIINSVFDNEGSTGAVTTVAGTGTKGRWYNVSLRGGGREGVAVDVDGSLELVKCSIRANGGDGVKCTKGKISLIECRVESNHGNGIALTGTSHGEVLRCHFSGNDSGIIHKESGCVTTCSGNNASVTLQPPKNIPGFRVTIIGSGAKPTTVALSG